MTFWQPTQQSIRGTAIQRCSLQNSLNVLQPSLPTLHAAIMHKVGPCCELGGWPDVSSKRLKIDLQVLSSSCKPRNEEELPDLSQPSACLKSL